MIHQKPINEVHQVPHPFVTAENIINFKGSPVAFVGKVDRIENGKTLYLKSHEGK
jgi:hypothetical protein